MLGHQAFSLEIVEGDGADERPFAKDEAQPFILLKPEGLPISRDPCHFLPILLPLILPIMIRARTAELVQIRAFCATMGSGRR